MTPEKSPKTDCDKEVISEPTINRLSVYLRCLNYLQVLGIETISSHELAKRFHLNSAQIRKDLACCGEFGIRGVGYNVRLLKDHLVQLIGLDRSRNAVIAGAGNLGMALADYKGFHSDGFHIVAMVEIDPAKFGNQSRSGVPVVSAEDLPQLVRSHKIEIGIIAVPAEHAQYVYDAMVDSGISAVLNFAPVQISRREGVKLKSVDLRINLESLSFYLKNVDEGICQENTAVNA